MYNGSVTDVVFFCDANETILKGMQRVRRDPLRGGCTGGGCNVCRMRVMAGRYEYCKRPNPIEPHVINMCGIMPRSDMVITPVFKPPTPGSKKRKKKGFFAALLDLISHSIFHWRNK